MRRAEERRRRVPALTYDDELPVSARREEIKEAIDQHQVIVVCGETGSGKVDATAENLPGTGARRPQGMIGHTQPRRLAARSIAARVAEEIGSSVGDLVGFKIRFSDETGPNTLVKLMTDGILLAETQGDKDFSPVRHDHSRRGARTVAQHRLPHRLPQTPVFRSGEI